MEQSQRGRPRLDPTTRNHALRPALARVLAERWNHIDPDNMNQEDLEELVTAITETTDEELLAHFGIRHTFNRRFSAVELFTTKPCQHMVGRKHCYRAESLSAALNHVLIVTAGGIEGAPTHLFYDRGCSLRYYLEGFLDPVDPVPLQQEAVVTKGSPAVAFGLENLQELYANTWPIVDPFHYAKHAHDDDRGEYCRIHCSPVHQGIEEDIMRESLFVAVENEDGEPEHKRIFNTERQESAAGFLGPFTRVTRSQKLMKAMFTIDMLHQTKNELTFWKLLDEGHDPRYIQPHIP